MNQSRIQRSVVIQNPEGMHARAAELFTRLAKKFESAIVVVKDNQRVDGKSMFEIFTLAAVPGTELGIEAQGPDAEQAADALCALVNSRFAENDAANEEKPS